MNQITEAAEQMYPYRKDSRAIYARIVTHYEAYMKERGYEMLKVEGEDEIISMLQDERAGRSMPIVDTLRKALAIGEARGREWIRVAERIPEESEDVLMLVEYTHKDKVFANVYTGFIDQYQGWHFGEHGEHIGPDRKATHWQPLPEKPKTD